MSELNGKTVIVTGAGKGIGRATAEMLARRGAKVVALTRTAADLQGLDARGIAVDLADVGETRRAMDAALPADLLVNCAGTTILKSFLDTTPEDLDFIHAVNTRSVLVASQIYASHVIGAGRGGAIVNVSSVSSTTGFIDHTAYCASKGALDAMSRVMANELGRHGIRVNCINPAVTLTPMAVKAWSDPAKAAPMLARMPMGRFIEPDEVAEVILFLLSDAASMINGVTLPIDAGFLAV
jgi:NAD(P)-dependent dehydrogenase (short-subunit alcohol dehydrogenase family)